MLLVCARAISILLILFSCTKQRLSSLCAWNQHTPDPLFMYETETLQFVYVTDADADNQISPGAN